VPPSPPPPDAASARAVAPLLPLLAAGAFVGGSGVRLLDPLLPAVAGEFGVTVGAASALLAAFTLTYGGGQALTGPLGDRFGKLRVIAAALLLYGLALLACAAASGMAALVALRALSGAFAGAVIPLAFAWIGDRVPYVQRQATLSRVLTGMVLAQLLTGPIAGVVGGRFGWRAAFLCLGVLALGTGVAVALRLRGQPAEPAAAAGGGLGLARYLEIARRPAARRLMAIAFAEGACLMGAAFPFVGAFAIEEFGLTAEAAGLLVAGFGVGAFAYTRAAPALVRRLGERRLVPAGGAVLVAVLAGYAMAPHWAVVAALQGVAGLGFYLYHGVLQTRATEALPEARGTAVAAFALMLFVGQSVGSVLAGALIAAGGYQLAFALAAAAMAAVTLWTVAALGGRKGRAGG
jgi:predicted MFS family arabinose efflux permease